MTVFAAPREGAQRRGYVYLDGDGERTITIMGDRIVPHGDDDLPWERLDDVDAVYFTGGDVGALHEARRARRLAQGALRPARGHRRDGHAHLLQADRSREDRERRKGGFRQIHR